MFKEYSKLIISLSKETDLNIVVRPHPADELEKYNFLNKYKNIKVINTGNISEWIHQAKMVIHSGCTGGLEASVRGLPTVSYHPFSSAPGHRIADRYSIKIRNLKECLNIVKRITENNHKTKKINLKDFEFRAHNILNNKPGYKVIVDEFYKLMKKSRIKHKNNDLVLKFKFKLRDIRSKLLKLEYGNIKFAFFDRSEVIKTFNALKKLDPKFKNLRVNLIKKDIIQIKKFN